MQQSSARDSYAVVGTTIRIGFGARGFDASRALTVVKVAKPTQDMRFDVPVIGVKTIETMAARRRDLSGRGRGTMSVAGWRGDDARSGQCGDRVCAD